MLRMLYTRIVYALLITLGIFLVTVLHILSFYSSYTLHTAYDMFNTTHTAQNTCVVVFGAAVWPGYFGPVASDALKDRIDNINPLCNYRGLTNDFLKMSENEILEIIKDADLIMLMTDNFDAQKRGNLFSLKYKIPAVFAIMYEKARCAEITFNIPGVTPACHRCATSLRYKEYDEGYKNTVTSESSTVFQTHYFNAAIGMITLAILHNDYDDVEFGNWFSQTWNRNLVQLRLNNNYSEMFENNTSLFERTFNTTEAKKRTFTFDSIWQTIEEEKAPKYEDCPDCGGIGNLKDVIISRDI